MKKDTTTEERVLTKAAQIELKQWLKKYGKLKLTLSVAVMALKYLTAQQREQALEDAKIKIRVQQVESDSPVIGALIKKENMDLQSAQAVEVARVKNLRYVWLDGIRLNAKELLKRVE